MNNLEIVVKLQSLTGKHVLVTSTNALTGEKDWGGAGVIESAHIDPIAMPDGSVDRVPFVYMDYGMGWAVWPEGLKIEVLDGSSEASLTG